MRFLIVEDEEKLATSIKKGLEKEGHAADYVLDGETAQRRIELYHKEYDLIILDLMLPGKDGFQICQAIRKQNILTPILVLTARSHTDDKITALDAGADDYLIKPFSFSELLARIRALLRRPNEYVPTEIKVGDIALNAATRSVFRKNKEIYLTLKKYELLEYFMRHPNQVLNREQITDHLWGFDYNSFSNIVDVHIKNLRKKLDDQHGRLLETIRGVGYRIKE